MTAHVTTIKVEAHPLIINTAMHRCIEAVVVGTPVATTQEVDPTISVGLHLTIDGSILSLPRSTTLLGTVANLPATTRVVHLVVAEAVVAHHTNTVSRVKAKASILVLRSKLTAVNPRKVEVLIQVSEVLNLAILSIQMVTTLCIGRVITEVDTLPARVLYLRLLL